MEETVRKEAISTPGTKNNKRYFLLIIAALMNFPTGSAALWSIFQPYAKDKFNLETGSANLPFSVFMASFVIGNILGGRLQQKMKARKAALIGSAIMCVGFVLTAFVPDSAPSLLSVTYGICSGLGAGCTYNVIIATITKWFPDRRGMASGIIVCTVGANGFVMSPICNHLLSEYGFSQTMLIVAVFYVILVLIGIWTIVPPPEGYMSDYKPEKKTASATNIKDYTAKEMIHTKAFWLVTGALAFSMTAYFLINPMVKSLGAERGLTEAMSVAVIMMLSVANCVGRITIPWISDRAGRKTMLFVLFGITIVAVLGLIGATGWLYMILASCIAFGYGGFFGIFPAIVTEQFGPKNSGLNYGIVMIGYGIISLLCPQLVTIGLSFAFGTAAVTCILGIVLVALIKPQQA